VRVALERLDSAASLGAFVARDDEAAMAGEDYGFTLPWTLTGWPAVSVRAGLDGATGLPLPVQVAAPHWNDHVALAAAGWIEETEAVAWS
jgi:Asp-tRNA(Asn)/Glu-tRNA(Gln) amidotransferase A subunit family amidase